MQRWELVKSLEFDSSVDEALRKVPGSTKAAARALLARIEAYQSLTIEELPKRDEEVIEDIDGNKLHFFALTYRKRVRIYIVPVEPTILFFSHTVFKKDQKLQDSDTRRVQNNYQAYQQARRSKDKWK